MPKPFDLLFVTPDHKLSELYLLEDVGAEKIGPAKTLFDRYGDLYMIPYVEGFDTLDNLLDWEKEEISVIQNNRAIKAWNYLI